MSYLVHLSRRKHEWKIADLSYYGVSDVIGSGDGGVNGVSTMVVDFSISFF